MEEVKLANEVEKDQLALDKQNLIKEIGFLCILDYFVILIISK